MGKKKKVDRFSEIFIQLLHFFKDEHKVMTWLITPNPCLADMKPVNFILLGRTKKLLNFIETSLEENSDA